MNNNKPMPKDNIQNILEKIRKNELTLKPKTYFRLRFAAFILVVVVLLVVSSFLSSFILFTIRASGQASLLGFGPSGWQVFLLSCFLGGFRYWKLDWLSSFSAYYGRLDLVIRSPYSIF